jgi:hypothetical protein
MNRKERRLTSKRLGILQFQSKLPIAKKLILMSQNIEAGRQREAEVREETRQEINSQLEEKESHVIYTMAEIIANRKKIPIIDAMDEAQREYDKGRKK